MPDIPIFFSQYPALFYLVIGVLGALIGSFLNVVIHRLPLMMQHAWRKECIAFLSPNSEAPMPAAIDGHHPSQPNTSEASLNLFTPRSHCVHCKTPIPFWHNIPILSYFLLRGRCHACKHAVSLRYLSVEVLCTMLTVITAQHFGLTTLTIGALLLTWALMAQTMIDIEHSLIPDHITLPVLWLGLMFNLNSGFAPLSQAVLGAMAGYLSLWVVAKISQPIFKRETMGHGDFKLLAMLGAWLGWQKLPMILLLSSFLGSFVGLALIALGRHSFQRELPFGPYLALAGWVSLLWGDPIMHWYLSGLGA